MSFLDLIIVFFLHPANAAGEQVSSWVGVWLLARDDLPNLAPLPFILSIISAHIVFTFSLSWSFFGAQDVLKPIQLKHPFRNPGKRYFYWNLCPLRAE